MMIRSIRVANWKSLVLPVVLDKLAPGINVIHGANGAGKSTIVGALVHAAFENHSSDKESTRAMVPWGRSLGPQVLLEFEIGTVRYRAEKQFIAQRRASLTKLEHGQWQPLAEGKQADLKIRELFDGDTTEKSSSSPQHWGIAQLLWAPQDQLALAHVSASTIDAMRSSLESQLADPVTATVQKACESLYAKSFTEKGALKSGKLAPAVVGLEAELRTVAEEIAKYREKLAEFDHLSTTIQQLRIDRGEAQQKLAERKQRQHLLIQAVEQYTQLLSQKTQQESASKIAQNEYKQLEQLLDAIKTLRSQLVLEREQLSEAALQTPTWRAQLDELTASEKQLAGEVDNLRAAWKILAERSQISSEVADLIRLRDSLAPQQQTIDEACALQERSAALEAELKGLPSPSTKEIDELDKLQRTYEQLRTQRDAALFHLEIKAEQQLDIEPIQAFDLTTKRLEAGASHTWRGSPEVAIRLPGIGTFRVSGPATSAADVQVKLDATEGAIRVKETALGSRDVAQLRVLAEQAANLARDVAGLKSNLSALLRGSSLADLEKRLRADQQKLESILTKYPAWRESIPDPQVLAQSLSDEKKQLDEQIATAEKLHRSSSQEIAQLKQKIALAESSQKTLEKSIEAKNGQLAALLADGLSDAAREEKKDELMLVWARAREKLKEATTQLEQLGSDPRAELKQLDLDVQQLTAAERQIDSHLIVATTKMEGLTDESLYTRLSQCEERAASLRTIVEEERLKLDAIKLLRQTMLEQQASMLRTLAAPIAHRAVGYLERMGLRKVSSIAIGDDFLLQGVVPGEHGAEVESELLSSGEQEQVHLAMRLAMAEIVAGEERQLLVLDDVLVATDASRLAAIKQILVELSERFQILLFTCHGERYRDITGAKQIDLEELKRVPAPAAAL